MLLFVIRHGDPIYNPDSLTPKGQRQAEAVGRRLALHGIDKIYASTNTRAQLTAQPTSELVGKKIEICDWMSENNAARDFMFQDPENDNRWSWSFGIEATRYRTEETLALGDKWYEAEPFCRSKAKQGYERIMRESDAFMENLGYKREGLNYRIIRPNDDRVAVFCHQGFGTTWLSHLLGVPPILFWSTFDMNHTGVTIIEFKNNKDGFTAPICLAVSDTSHLYAERLPLRFANGIKI